MNYRTQGVLPAPRVAPTRTRPGRHEVCEAGPVRVLVVGGGLAGLTAAHILSQDGHEVTVLEAAPEPGT